MIDGGGARMSIMEAPMEDSFLLRILLSISEKNEIIAILASLLIACFFFI